MKHTYTPISSRVASDSEVTSEPRETLTEGTAGEMTQRFGTSL